MKDITLRDGTRIPKGTMVSVNMHAQRQDNAPLEDADTFDAFRYACMRSAEGQSQKNRLTTTSPDYISFGVTMLGVCPFYSINDCTRWPLMMDLRFQPREVLRHH